MEVTDFTERLRWPVTTLYGQPTPVVSGRLVRAITYWWEVNRHLVCKWRKCLGVGRMTAGTTRLRRMQTFDDRDRAKSTATLRTAPYRQKSSRRARRRWAREKHIGRYRRWTRREIRLLGAEGGVTVSEVNRAKLLQMERIDTSPHQVSTTHAATAAMVKNAHVNVS